MERILFSSRSEDPPSTLGSVVSPSYSSRKYFRGKVGECWDGEGSKEDNLLTGGDLSNRPQ